MKDTDIELLNITLRVSERERLHLEGVHRRLFPQDELTLQWLVSTLRSPEGIDRLESFNGKFSRLQDTIMDKLLPRLLVAIGELSGSAIDNLNKAEKLGLPVDTDQWIAMRRLRNRLVHEYIDNPAEMLDALKSARDFTHQLLACQQAIARYAEKQLKPST